MKLNANALLTAVCTAISFLPFFCLQADGESATCESLAQFKIDHGEVNSAQAVPFGPVTVVTRPLHVLTRNRGGRSMSEMAILQQSSVEFVPGDQGHQPRDHSPRTGQ
jgi:hypothetical protein